MGLTWTELDATHWAGHDVDGDLYATATSFWGYVEAWIAPWGCGFPKGLRLRGFETFADAMDAADRHVVAYVDVVGSGVVHFPAGGQPRPPKKGTVAAASAGGLPAWLGRSDDGNDVLREIRTLRAVNRYRPCRYRLLLEMRLGDVTQTGAAVQRLKRAGYVDGDDRALDITVAGRAALARLDHEPTRRQVLAEVFYGRP